MQTLLHFHRYIFPWRHPSPCSPTKVLPQELLRCLHTCRYVHTDWEDEASGWAQAKVLPAAQPGLLWVDTAYQSMAPEGFARPHQLVKPKADPD